VCLLLVMMLGGPRSKDSGRAADGAAQRSCSPQRQEKAVIAHMLWPNSSALNLAGLLYWHFFSINLFTFLMPRAYLSCFCSISARNTTFLPSPASKSCMPVGILRACSFAATMFHAVDVCGSFRSYYEAIRSLEEWGISLKQAIECYFPTLRFICAALCSVGCLNHAHWQP